MSPLRFILPFAMMAAGRALHGSSEELFALMQFGEEEAKHIVLFERFGHAFELGFGSVCSVVGPATDLAGVVLAEDPLAVALLVLHIEWMTQEHYLRAARSTEVLDDSFKNLLRCHWIEEAQHARLDALVIEQMVRSADEARRERAVEVYVGVLERLADALRVQVELDREAFERAGGSIPPALATRWQAQQTGAYREAFLRTGLVHPKLRQVLRSSFGPFDPLLDAAAARFEGGTGYG